MKKILSVFGTRPEAIKMAPVVKILDQTSNFQHKVCVTGQHREMLDAVLQLFDIKPDYDLELMKNNQNLNTLTASLLVSIKRVFDQFKPDLVLVHGDTATSFGVALACFFEKIPVAHVEAGLRTGNKHSPWPEEMNRVLTANIADLHFAPTNQCKNNLISEKVRADKIIVTGNTVIDSLLSIVNLLKESGEIEETAKKELNEVDLNRKIILVTGHRRENFGSGFEKICAALRILAEKYPTLDIIYPVHLNPNVKNVVENKLGNISNVKLIKPLGYLSFVYLMQQSYLVLTDSGGIQEEAPALGKPVLVMRDNTERPEALAAGTIKLVGTKVNAIVENVSRLIEDQEAYRQMARAENPYGDGTSSAQIKAAIEEFLC